MILIHVRASFTLQHDQCVENVLYCRCHHCTVICVVMCCRVSHMSCCHFLTNDNTVLSWQLALTTPAPPEPRIYIFSTDDEPRSWTKGKLVRLFHLSIIGICFGLSRQSVRVSAAESQSERFYVIRNCIWANILLVVCNIHSNFAT